MFEPVLLGLYSLDRVIGRGSSGQVWRATDRQGKPVAVKILRLGGDERLRHELYIGAALDHEHILGVLDAGTVDEAAAVASSGALVSGDPYLVLEYAGGGTLMPRCGQLAWGEVRRVLTALLGALGHAHARGVLHRDVKPGNVLIGEGDEIWLADFGLAHRVSLGRRDGDEAAVGTLRYMAPEQRLGRWRDQGPWTDLYAVGRLTLALLMGPLDSPWVPPPVPQGLVAWLGRLLAPRPSERFQLASDALYALRRLHHTADEDPGLLRGLIDPSASPTRMERRVPPPPPEAPTDRVLRPAWAASPDVVALRTVPFVGRDDLRRRGWSKLLAVRASGRPQVVVLQGPGGSGKSRVAEHLAQHASESGVGAVLHLDCAGEIDVLPRLVASHLMCLGLGLLEVRQRITEHLAEHGVDDVYEVEALTDLVRGAVRGVVEVDDDDAEVTEEQIRVRFGQPSERWGLVDHWLKRLTRVRPLLVWLDDVDASPDALRWLAWVVRHSRAAVMYLVTIRDEALAAVPEVGIALQELLAADRVTLERVEPLSAPEHGQLLAHLVGENPPLVQVLAEHTAGSPQFAVQLVRDLVAQGRLKFDGDRLFRVDAAPLALPAGLDGLWAARIEGLLHGLPPSAGVALERAAVFGLELDDGEWGILAAGLGLDERAQHDLLFLLFEARFAVSTETGWRLANVMVREALRIRGRAGGRAAEHHRACAEELGLRGPAAAERCAAHWREAGEPSRAITPLFEAISFETDRGEPLAALRAADALEDLLKRHTSPNDSRRGALAGFRAELLFLAGRYDDVVVVCEQLAAFSALGANPEFAARGAIVAARVAMGRGQFAEARAGLERALTLPNLDTNVRGAAQAAFAVALTHSGAAARAVDEFSLAIAVLEAAGDGEGAAFARKGRAAAWRQLGQLDRAAAEFSVSSSLLQRLGRRTAAAECQNGLGDIRRLQGDLTGAELAYEEALVACVALGSWHGHVIRVNLALVRIAQRRFLDAYTALIAEIEALDGRALDWLRAVAHAACLPCAAAERDFTAFDVHRRAAEALFAHTEFADVDVAQLAERAGTLCKKANQPEAARAAFRLAAAQWEACGRADAAARSRAAAE